MAKQLWIGQTCGETCPHYYQGRYTGRHVCYKEHATADGGQIVSANAECLYGLKVRAPKKQKNVVMVPVQTVSPEHFRQLDELRRSTRAVSYLMVLADELDERVFSGRKR
jgi:hypothetical protein